MSDKSKTRAERREHERELRKDFASVAKELRTTLDERQDDDFKMAIMTALQNLEGNPSENILTAALMLRGCVDCEARKDEATARLLLYVAGVIVEPHLTIFALRTLMSAQQMVATATGKNGPPTL